MFILRLCSSSNRFFPVQELSEDARELKERILSEEVVAAVALAKEAGEERLTLKLSAHKISVTFWNDVYTSRPWFRNRHVNQTEKSLDLKRIVQQLKSDAEIKAKYSNIRIKLVIPPTTYDGNILDLLYYSTVPELLLCWDTTLISSCTLT